MSQRHARAGVRVLALPPGFSFTGLPVLKPLRCADQSQRALNELRQAHTLTAETHSRLTNALPHTSTHTNTHKHTHTPTYTHTNTHTHTHTGTQLNTQTQIKFIIIHVL